PHAGCNHDRDGLQLFAARQRNPLCFQVNFRDRRLLPKIKLGTINIRGKKIEQFFAVTSFQAEVISDWVVNTVKLSADLFGLFEHERVQAQLIAPESSREPRWSSTDDDNVVHSSKVLMWLRA